MIELQVQEVAGDSFDWQKLAENAKKIQDIMHENDPGTLKAGYRAMFKEIIVGNPDSHGKAQLKFVLHNDDAPVVVTAAENYSVRREMVDQKHLNLNSRTPPRN